MKSIVEELEKILGLDYVECKEIKEGLFVFYSERDIGAWEMADFRKTSPQQFINRMAEIKRILTNYNK